MDKNKYNSNEINTPTLYHEDKGDDIDIKEMIAKVWYKRKFIILCTSFFILFGLFIAFTSPIRYSASSTVVPQTGSKGGVGSLGGIASMMGVNIGSSMSSETLSPYVYPQIINSVPFCKEIMKTPIVVEKSNGVPITLYEYYTDKQYSSTNVLGVVKKYTVGLPGMLISLLRSSDSKSASVVTDSITGQVLTITKEEQKVIQQIQKNIQFKSNDKEGYIILGYSFSEPKATAVIAQGLYSTLEKYVTSYKSQKQQDNLAFVQESYERSRDDFMKKQAKLAAFQDANRDLNSAIARTTERRLSSEYDIAYTVYNELARQLEQAKISVKESTPILTVIDPVVIPNKKSAPSRALILIGFTFLGLVASVSWVFIKPFIREVVSVIKNKNAGIESL